MKRHINNRFARLLALMLAIVLTVTLCATGCVDANDPTVDEQSSVSESISSSSTTAALSDTAEPPSEIPSDTKISNEAELPSSSEDIEPTQRTSTVTSAAPEPIPNNSTFEVHYIDVGQADAALVLCDGQAMLIDGGNVADSNLIYAYLSKLSLNHLEYIVCTHAHEDHVGGLSGALNYATVDVAFSPVTSYDSKAFGNFVTYLERQNVSITVPKAGDSFSLGSSTVSILGPIRSSTDPNNTSIVLRVVYGETSFLFTGDAERDEEQDIINAGYALDSTVLKVGHHGSETSTSYVFLREIMPEYAVISVGAGNSYGHPTDAVLSRLRDADVKIFRTDLQGDVICSSDGKTVSFSVDRNSDADTLSSAGSNSTQGNGNAETTKPEQAIISNPEGNTTASISAEYVLNTNTHKFHYPGCSSVKQMAEKNKQNYIGMRDEIMAMGYEPCQKCNP